jgi:hypothetical protein
MGDVYKYPWCNIAATGFENGLAGMFVSRNPYSMKPLAFNIEVRVPRKDASSKLIKGPFYCIPDILYTDVVTAPLNRRAWVYQERVLSRRILHLGSRQAFWECNEKGACESFPRGFPPKLVLGMKPTIRRDLLVRQAKTGWSRLNPEPGHEIDEASFENGVLESWWHMVFKYNCAQLTKYEDKLVAFVGIAKEVQVILKGKYVAGLWRKHLVHHLTWTAQPTLPEDGSSNLRVGRPQMYQAPS